MLVPPSNTLDSALHLETEQWLLVALPRAHLELHHGELGVVEGEADLLAPGGVEAVLGNCTGLPATGVQGVAQHPGGEKSTLGTDIGFLCKGLL